MKQKDLFNYLMLYFDDEGNGDDGGNAGGTPGGDGGKDKGGTKPAKGGNDGNKNNDDDRTTPRYSDADLDKIIEKKFAKWKKQQDAAVDEATRLANMTAQERAEHERDKLQKELDELKAANTRAEMEKTARGILKEDGVNVSDTIVALLVGKDADTTSENVKAFAKAYKADLQAEVKKQLSHKTPATGSAGTLTKADIMKEKDPIKRQKLIRENMSLFKN